VRATVYLIGTGPGAPDLITLRGFRCLQAADVVIYDHLVHARLLESAPAAAERIDVGSAAPQRLDQEAICYLLAEKARERKTVARLKWGDPFVFDRGGVEAAFLHEQGIPFEVIPGVPAASGIAAYAGIPLTHPGGGDTVTLIRGHDAEDGDRVSLDWDGLGTQGGTLACFANPRYLPRVVEALLAHGRPPDEPAAFITNGTLPSQQTLATTLGGLAHAVREAPPEASGLLLVGKVVGLRDHMRWFDARPLFGRRVLVTRSLDQAAELVDPLERAGAETISAPLIRIAPVEDPGPLDRACAGIGAYDWMVLTSPNAVQAYFERLLRGHRDLRALGRVRICAIGPGTAARLTRLGVAVDLAPDEHHAQGVAAALAARGPLETVRVLMPGADLATDAVAEALREAGAAVDQVLAYRTVIAESDAHLGIYRQLLDRRIDVVTFTSASAIRAFVALNGADQTADLLAHTVVATMGPATAEAAAHAGVAPAVRLAIGTMTAFVDALVQHMRRR